MLDAFKLTAILISGILWGAWLVLVLRKKDVHPLRDTLEGFGRLGWMKKVGVLFIVVQLTMFGGAKHGGTNDVDDVTGTNDVELVEGGTNDVGEAASSSLLMGMHRSLTSGETPLPCHVLPYRLESVLTNEGYSYVMPANGAIRGTWYLTGAYEDVQKVALGEFRFPLGSNLCDSLWAYTWGKVRPQFNNASNEIAAVGAPMSAIPDVSRFWTATTSNDTYLLTWENFAVGRITAPTNTSSLIPHPSSLVSVQLELKRNGDFITRSNDVECVYRRVIEPNPIVYPINPSAPDDPTKPLYPYGPVQDLSVIEEPNAYCWVDIVVNTADAWVHFAGDGASNLADPSFAAKAGETNHVVILIGKAYKVTCDMSLTVVDKSDPAIDEWWENGNTLWLDWPVDIWSRGDDDGPPLLLMSFGNGSYQDNGFTMFVSPSGLGGEFSWTNSCCAVYGSGLHFSYDCDGFCLCGGCSAQGYYGYEGYRIGCSGGSCGCSWYDDDDRHGEDDSDDPEPTPSISVSFSKQAVIFEDEYTNMPGQVVQWQSTTTKLILEAHGGMKGGTATFTFTNKEKLIGPDIPTSITVPAGHCKTYEFAYRGNLASGGEKDITVHGEFRENNPDEGCQPLTSDDELTSVKVKLEAVYEAPENHNSSRHIYGVGEQVKLMHNPANESVDWSIGDSDCFSELADGIGCDKVLKLHYLGGTTTAISAKYKDAEYSPAISVIEPQAIVCKRQEWDGNSASKGQAGGVGMNLWLYIEPMCVSFQGIDVAEIPCNTVVPPTGYYASTNFNGVLSHTLDAEAGYWHHVGDGNYWCQDQARSNIRRPIWDEGTLIWNIPIQWYQRLESSGSWPRGFIHADGRLIGGSEGAYRQIFNMSPEGTVKVTKHGHWVDRTTNDVIRLDGVVVHTDN